MEQDHHGVCSDRHNYLRRDQVKSKIVLRFGKLHCVPSAECKGQAATSSK